MLNLYFVRPTTIDRLQFGEFARCAGASTWEDLPNHVEPFLDAWLKRQAREYSNVERQAAVRGIRGPIEQLLQQHCRAGVPMEPFSDVVPGFFDFLRRDRGLREGYACPVSALSWAA